MSSEFFPPEGSHLIAILRGACEDELVDIAALLLDCGFRHIEIPLLDESSFASLEKLQKTFSERLHCGAGTVVSIEQISHLADVGVQYFLSPHLDERLLEHAAISNIQAIPGVMTVTEIFRAHACGANLLKVFPASQLGPAYFKALQAVLPSTVQLMAVGGIHGDNLNAYRQAGVNYFAIGSELYRPGIDLVALEKRAKALIASSKNSDE